MKSQSDHLCPSSGCSIANPLDTCVRNDKLVYLKLEHTSPWGQEEQAHKQYSRWENIYKNCSTCLFLIILMLTIGQHYKTVCKICPVSLFFAHRCCVLIYGRFSWAFLWRKDEHDCSTVLRYVEFFKILEHVFFYSSWHLRGYSVVGNSIFIGQMLDVCYETSLAKA